MPVNRNALLRYRVIDECLRNPYRRWTLDDLVEACAEALYEYEGIDKGVSKRTIQLDIQMMRSDKLGYEAPIIVVDKKYYTYADPNYSITNIPLSNRDLSRLQEVVQILKQFKGFKHFEDLATMTQRLEDKVRSRQTQQAEIIDFEKNEQLKGLSFLEPLYQNILAKKCLDISYQSFRAQQNQVISFSPYLLKEYRNRWFLLGKSQNSTELSLLALDRIVDIQPSLEEYEGVEERLLRHYFKDVIGVTASSRQKVEEVKLFINKQNAPYVATKPMHHSQKIEEELPNGIIISLRVQLNFELEREILGFGEAAKVLSPLRLRQRIYQRQRQAIEFYDIEVSEGVIKGLVKRWQHRGLAIFNQIYTQGSRRHLKKLIAQYQHKEKMPQGEDIDSLIKQIPSLHSTIFNQNLSRLIRQISPSARLLKSGFCANLPETWEKTMPQLEVTEADFIIWICLAQSATKRMDLSYYAGSDLSKQRPETLELLLRSSLPETESLAAADVILQQPNLLMKADKNPDFTFIYLVMAKA